VLCGLDGDDAKESTLRLLRGALNPHDYAILRVTLSARCIRLGPWYAGKDMTAGSKNAERVLRGHGADAVLWGEVPKQGESLRFFLRGAGRQETQIILFDKGLAKERPDGALGTVLAAVALSQITPVTEQAGQYLASRLRPVAGRLEALLAEPRLVPAVESGNLHHALGMTLSGIGEQTGDNSVLENAIASYRAALEERSRERVPLEWAMTQNYLGNTLKTLGERESGTARLEEATTAYRAALEERSRERVPLDWAVTQNNLGNALERLGERESATARTAHLEAAVAAYQAALEERTRARVSLGWAQTQNNLGLALTLLGQRENGTARTAHLEAAVAAHQAALEERTRARVPLDWAQTQNNLGIALGVLGEQESGTWRLEAAIATFNEALKEYTRDRVPLDWAMTQTNLGNALKMLGERESGTAYLEAAAAAYRAALGERTRDRAPFRWALTQNNLGNALKLLDERESVLGEFGKLGAVEAGGVWGFLPRGTAHLEAAVAAFDACLTVAETGGPEEWVQKVRSRRDETRAEIARRTVK
jgi:tetratricopeptide (TPR) repeat protein